MTGNLTGNSPIGDILFNNTSNLVGRIRSNRLGADNSASMDFSVASAGTMATALAIAPGGAISLSSGLGTSNTGDYLCINTGTYEINRGNGAACSTSSIRFKGNILDLKYGLVEVLKLRPVTFKYKSWMNRGSGVHLGFIAEEMERVVPELVNHDAKGLPSGIDYPVVTSLLTRAMQQQQQAIELLSRRLDEARGGAVLKATDGPKCFRVTVNNAGALSTVEAPCQ